MLKTLLNQALLVGALLAVTAAAQDKVRTETLAVHESRDAKSSVVKTLKQGQELVVDMSITGEDGAQWCTIREKGQKDRLGYVHCDSLDRPARAVLRPAVAAAPRQVASASSVNWNPTATHTLGENRWMGYAVMMAAAFHFDETQKQQVLQLANQWGIPACIKTTDSYKGKGLPPEIGSQAVTQCHWNAQYFAEQVFALITPEQKAAQATAYATFGREVGGGRAALEKRPKAQQ